jgi:hypothetical protein
MSKVAKVYRVEVRYPPRGGRITVKYGGKQMVAQTWRHYQMAVRSCKFHGLDLSSGVFKVGVANSAVFQDITAMYETEQAIGL